MRIGKALKEIRKHKGISQMQLAEQIGISQTSLSQIESDIKRPSVSTIKKICEILEVSEPLVYLMATEESDVPESRRMLFNALLPTLKSVVLQIAGPDLGGELS